MTKNYLLGTLSALAIISASFSAHAINITADSDANSLAASLLVPGSGLSIDSASLMYGANGVNPFPQSGTYVNPQGTYGLGSGIVLSSGNANDYNTLTPPTTDPDGMFNGNSTGNTSGNNNPATGPQEGLLNPITGQPNHFDPVQLDIEFSSASDSTVTFFATFGSEEWPEFVGSFQDGFGLYVNGNNVAGAQPTGTTNPPVLPQPINIDHPDMQLIPGTELDGILAPNGNPVLRFDVPVQAGLNTLTAIIADANDDALDTTVFLSALQGEDNSNDGSSEFAPLLPSNPPGPDGEIVIEIAEEDVPNGTFFIDPDVVTGYTVSIVGGDFSSTTMPSLATIPDTDGYVLSYFDAMMMEQMVSLSAGQTFMFPNLLTEFMISDINPDLMLDPSNPLAFPLGVDVENVQTGGLEITMAPKLTFVPSASVPEPGVLVGMVSGMLGIALYSRRRSR